MGSSMAAREGNRAEKGRGGSVSWHLQQARSKPGARRGCGSSAAGLDCSFPPRTRTVKTEPVVDLEQWHKTHRTDRGATTQRRWSAR
uniref:Uncharacterized protein n=1 Tax=Arundo donax TaxID=35708 RepID=A0A0A9A6E8_ARUDO